MQSRLLLVLSGICVLASHAQAQSYLVTATSSTYATAFGLPHPPDPPPPGPDAHSETHTGPTQAAASTSSSVYWTGYGADGTLYPNYGNGSSSVVGRQGLITGSASANDTEGTGMAEAAASWTDTLTVGSATLAPGTPALIHFKVHYTVPVSLTANSFVEHMQSAEATSNLSFLSRATDTAAQGASLSLDFTKFDRVFEYGSFDKAYDMTLQGDLLTTVGATVSLDSSVDLTLNTYGRQFRQFAIGSLNGFSSSLFADSVTEGVTLSSRSGVGYAATPEPGTLAFGAAGLFFGSMIRRSRKRHV